jgi:hypothetical protein
MASSNIPRVPPTLDLRFPFFMIISLSLQAPLATWWPSPASAEIRIVTSQGEHRMGDRDTREDAVRLATEAAKRDALEQVATYLESVTVVEGTDVTRDEIRTYSAGLVLVLDQQTTLALDGDTIVVRVDLTSQVDTEEVAQAIAALRENEDARHQLLALREENQHLLEELDAANQALASASSLDQVQQASQQRQEILDRVQSNSMVAQAWTDWVIVSPVVYPYPLVGLAQTRALLSVARGLYPASPHVDAAQHVIATKPPPPPSQTPIMTMPRPTPQVPGFHTVPSTASQPVPKTLNEITHLTTAPPQIGNQPPGTPSSFSRALTDVRQLNPFLPAPGGAPPAHQMQPPTSRSVQALNQFLRPPAAAPPAVQPPIARRLPPTINQVHPPLPHQVPRVPYHFTPRGSGGGHGGGGMRGGGGGRGGGGRGR